MSNHPQEISKSPDWGNLPKELILEIMSHNKLQMNLPLLSVNKWWRTQILDDSTAVQAFKTFFATQNQVMKEAISAAETSNTAPFFRSIVDVPITSNFKSLIELEELLINRDPIDSDEYKHYHHERDSLTLFKSLQKRINSLKKLLEKPLPPEGSVKHTLFTKKIKKLIQLISDIESIFEEYSKPDSPPSFIKTLDEKLHFISISSENQNKPKSQVRAVTEIKETLQKLADTPQDISKDAVFSDLKALGNKTRVAIKGLVKETNRVASRTPDYSYSYESMDYFSPASGKSYFLMFELIRNLYKEPHELQKFLASQISSTQEYEDLREKTQNLNFPDEIIPGLARKLLTIISPKDPATICLYKANQLIHKMNTYEQLQKRRDNILDHMEGEHGNFLHWEKYFSAISDHHTSAIEKILFYFFDGYFQLFKFVWKPVQYAIISTCMSSNTPLRANYLSLLSLAKLLGANLSDHYRSRYGEKFAQTLEKMTELPQLNLSDVLRLQREFEIPISYQLLKLEVDLMLKEYSQHPLGRFKHPQRSNAIHSIECLIDQLNHSNLPEDQIILIFIGGLIHHKDETANSHTKDKKGFSSFMHHKLKTQSTLEMGLTNILNTLGMQSDGRTKAVNAYSTFQSSLEENSDLTATVQIATLGQ